MDVFVGDGQGAEIFVAEVIGSDWFSLVSAGAVIDSAHDPN